MEAEHDTVRHTVICQFYRIQPVVLRTFINQFLNTPPNTILFIQKRSYILLSQLTIFGLSLTYLLTPWSTVLLEKLTEFQLVKKFSAFYVTRKFITAVTCARHLSLSWALSMHSIHPHPTYWLSIWTLLSHLRLGLPSDLFPSGFPTKTLCMSLLSTMRPTRPAHLVLLDFITRVLTQ